MINLWWPFIKFVKICCSPDGLRDFISHRCCAVCCYLALKFAVLSSVLGTFFPCHLIHQWFNKNLMWWVNMLRCDPESLAATFKEWFNYWNISVSTFHPQGGEQKEIKLILSILNKCDYFITSTFVIFHFKISPQNLCSFEFIFTEGNKVSFLKKKFE